MPVYEASWFPIPHGSIIMGTLVTQSEPYKQCCTFDTLRFFDAYMCCLIIISSHVRCQAIIKPMLIYCHFDSSEQNVSQIRNKIKAFQLRKKLMKISCTKWWQFCPGFNNGLRSDLVWLYDGYLIRNICDLTTGYLIFAMHYLQAL